MGRKVHPTGFRLGIVTDWQSRWFAERNYTELLHEDFSLRQLIRERLKGAAVSRIEIQRSANQVEITLHTAKPGIVIGKKGASVDMLRKELEEVTTKKVRLNIEEIRQPEMDAYLVAESIAGQAERFDVLSRIKHHAFPGGRLLRTPALVLGMFYYRLRELLGA